MNSYGKMGQQAEPCRTFYTVMFQCDSHADIHVYLMLPSWRSHAIAMQLHG